MIAVALHPFLQVALPQLAEIHASTRVLTSPFVIEFIHHEDAVLIAKVEERLAVRIVRRANMVVAKCLEQLDALLFSTRIDSCTKSAKRVMVGISLQQHLLAIELHTKSRRKLHSTNAECLRVGIHGIALLIENRHLCCIEIGMLAVPELRIGNVDGLELKLLGMSAAVALAVIVLLCHHLSLRVTNHRLHLHHILTCVTMHSHLHIHLSIVLRRNVKRMTLQIELRIRHEQMHIAEESTTRVPA